MNGRRSLSWTAQIGKLPLRVHLGLSDEGKPVAVSAELGAIGSPKEGLLRCYCVALTKLLARGVPLSELDALLDRCDEDAGETGDELVPWAGSLGSYMVRSVAAHAGAAT